MHTHRLDAARRQAREQATHAFSFDVFDTFLLRRCTQPDGVFERACHFAPVRHDRPGLVETYVQHRVQAEARARQQAHAERGSPELVIEDIYRVFPFRLFGLDRGALDTLVQAEFDAECDLCFANPDMVRLYDDLRASGVRVGFISDTYWDDEQLGRLLRHCRGGLAWDFLYASCRHRAGKGEGLFGRYLAGERIAPDVAIHIGDNVAADIKGAERHGIRTIHYRQSGPRLSSVCAREAATGAIIGSHHSGRLDGGLRTARRLIAARAPARSPAFALGVEVLGPIMAAFDRFVADRIAGLVAPDRRVGVAFVARDGYLPLQLRQLHGGAGAYVEVNRRTAMLAGAHDIAPLAEFFGKMPAVDAAALGEFFKILPPRAAAFFADSPTGVVTGAAFAKALPGLIDAADVARISADMRRGLMAHLRARIPGFDTLTDLVLVDLGYTGTVQKALRRVFDLERLPIRLHGLYLLTSDDGLADVVDADAAEGFLSGQVLTPHVTRLLLNNIGLLERLCAASEGAARSYRDGEVVREPDPRSRTERTLCEDAGDGAQAFARLLGEFASVLDPFDDLPRAAAVAAGLLARLLLLPTDDELALFGDLRHDVNLGSQMTVPMIDATAAGDLEAAVALPTAFMAAGPPMWLAGSMAALSPVHGFLYAAFGGGAFTSDVFGDAKCGTVDVTLVCGERRQTVQASCFRTGFGAVRIRIPILARFGAEALSVPLAAVASEGLLDGVMLQGGNSMLTAMFARTIIRLPASRLTARGLDLHGRHYVATGTDGRLVIALPERREAATMVTVTLTPLTGRVLALAADPDEP